MILILASVFCLFATYLLADYPDPCLIQYHVTPSLLPYVPSPNPGYALFIWGFPFLVYIVGIVIVLVRFSATSVIYTVPIYFHVCLVYGLLLLDGFLLHY